MVDLWIAIFDVMAAHTPLTDLIEPVTNDARGGIRRHQRPMTGMFKTILVFRQAGKTQIRRSGRMSVPIVFSPYVVEGQGFAADVRCARIAEEVEHLFGNPNCNFNTLFRGGDPCAPVDGLLVYDVVFDGQQGDLRFDDRAKAWTLDDRFTWIAATCSYRSPATPVTCT